jgi:hypothetical protein
MRQVARFESSTLMVLQSRHQSEQELFSFSERTPIRLHFGVTRWVQAFKQFSLLFQAFQAFRPFKSFITFDQDG